MQHCSCSVHLQSNRNHVVMLDDVTVAEIEILRAVHGQGAVQDIKPTHKKNSSAAAELDRLRKKYRRKLQTSPQQRGNVVDAVYPGPRPSLPGLLADIGLDYKGDDKKTTKKKGASSTDEEVPAEGEELFPE